MPDDPVRLACLKMSEVFEQQWIASGLCAEASRQKRATAGIAAPKFEPEEYDMQAPKRSEDKRVGAAARFHTLCRVLSTSLCCQQLGCCSVGSCSRTWDRSLMVAAELSIKVVHFGNGFGTGVDGSHALYVLMWCLLFRMTSVACQVMRCRHTVRRRLTSMRYPRRYWQRWQRNCRSSSRRI